MTAAGNIQSNQKKAGSAEGSIGYGERSGAYAQAKAVEKLLEDRPPEAGVAAPAAEAVKDDADARPGYDFEQKRKTSGRKSGAYGQAESLETLVEDPPPKAVGAIPDKEGEKSGSAAQAGYDFELKRKTYGRNIGHRPWYKGGNRKKKSGAEESYIGYLEGFQAQGQADFAESWMGDLPLEAAIDAMAREELETNSRARHKYQFEQKRQAFTLPGHKNLRVNPNKAEKHLPRYTPEEFAAMGLVKSVEEFPFKLESDGRLSRVRFLVYLSAKQMYDENRDKAKGLKPGFLAEAAKMAGTLAYTELSNPLNAIGGVVGGQVRGRLLKKAAVGGAAAGGMDFAVGLAGKAQAERWGAEITMEDVVGSALVSVGMGAGFTVVGEAAKGLAKRARRFWNDWRAGRKQSGSDETGLAYGDRLDSPGGIGNNEFQDRWTRLSPSERIDEYGSGWTPEYRMESIFNQPLGKKGVVSGDPIGRTMDEISFAEELANMGNNVQWTVHDSTQKNADFFINGVKSELKTSKTKVNDSELSRKLAKDAYSARKQARYIIIDARNQPGMTQDIAEIAIKRAFGKNKSAEEIMEITILTKDGPVTIRPPWRMK